MFMKQSAISSQRSARGLRTAMMCILVAPLILTLPLLLIMKRPQRGAAGEMAH